MDKLLEVKNLSLSFFENGTRQEVLKNISFEIGKKEIVGIVGESGSGKSMTALSVMRLLAENAAVTGGEILFEGKNLLALSESDMQSVRGDEISMVFQEPMTSLNPVMKIGVQVAESLKLHTDMKKDEIYERVIGALKSVGLPEPEKLYHRYPYELSGGMRQRVMIAMATVCSPKLLIADEATTALDVTVQKQILKLIKKFHQETKTSVLLISHDLNVIKSICDRVIVMYRGDIVETGEAKEVLARPKHEYTKTLVASIPDNEQKADFKNPVFKAENLRLSFKEKASLFSSGKKRKEILKGVSFEIYQGEILGVVGESGCGKSTLARVITGLYKHYTGTIKMTCPKPQMVFQDPFGSLNPSRKLGWILEEPLKLKGVKDKRKRIEQVDAMLEEIGLDASYKDRYAKELSGGQRQRISIGLALLMDTGFIVADEPVSALDVTVQGQILKLLLKVHEEQNLTMLFISHDLEVVRHMCTRVIVMYLGEIVEIADSGELYNNPLHPYTNLLFSAALSGGRLEDGGELEENKESGEIAAGEGGDSKAAGQADGSGQEGCAFYPRCPHRSADCLRKKPELVLMADGHLSRCGAGAKLKDNGEKR